MSTDGYPGDNPLLRGLNHDADFNEQTAPAGNALRTCANTIRPLINGSNTPDDIFNRIVETLTSIPGVQSAAIFLAPDSRSLNNELKIVAQAGSQEIPEPATSRTKSGRIKLPTRTDSEKSPHRYTKITSQGKTMGWLGVATEDPPCGELDDCLNELAFYAGIAYEKPIVSAQMRHFSNKLEVLAELNNLVASGTGLEKIMRTLAREAAYRFSANCAVSFLLTDSKDTLEIKGSYGCPPNSLPNLVEISDTQLGRALNLGGTMSVPNLKARDDHGLMFLTEHGFSCVHWSSIDIRGSSLGAILIGFKQHKELTEHQADLLEEFARSAAVAILNAKTRDQLAKYAGKLEDLVEERTADLAVQTSLADEANLAKSRFVANMSHELRTPLTAIIGYSSVVAEGIFGELNQEQKDSLNSISKAGEHLKELINDVLDVSKVEAGKEDPEPIEIPVYQLLEQIHKLMMQTAMGKGVKLNPIDKPKDEAEASLKIIADRRHLRQILINIISNAIKYTPSDGSVSLFLEKMGDKAKITISDTGVGMTEEQQDKAFERFGRCDDSYSKTQVGTGIGLALTLRLVEINGGKIGVESEPGKGSDFWILMPMAGENTLLDNDSSADDSEEMLSGSRLDGLNVLVVDDNHSTCEVLKTIIKSMGGNPYIAYSVAEAKEIAVNTSLDTALIDLAIPGENGIDLLDFFRGQCEKPLSTMPLIVVSACVFDKDKSEALEHGASAFIDKPFAPSTIATTIRNLTTAALLNSH